MDFSYRRFFTSIAVGVLCGIVTVVVLTAVFSLLITVTSAGLKVTGFFATVILICAALLGGFVSAYRFASKGWLAGLFTGFMLYLILLIATVVFLRSAATSSVIAKVLIMLSSGTIGGILGVNRANVRKI